MMVVGSDVMWFDEMCCDHCRGQRVVSSCLSSVDWQYWHHHHHHWPLPAEPACTCLLALRISDLSEHNISQHTHHCTTPLHTAHSDILPVYHRYISDRITMRLTPSSHWWTLILILNWALCLLIFDINQIIHWIITNLSDWCEPALFVSWLEQ